jgi:hypothetical protein
MGMTAVPSSMLRVRCDAAARNTAITEDIVFSR